MPNPTLVDVNVWLATLHRGHPHHTPAIDWWRRSIAPARTTVLFCRLTQLALLRLLSNERVMGASRRSPDQAWADYRAILDQPLVGFVAEPEGLDAALVRLTRDLPPSTGLWTDAYLAALAITADLGLATFDRGFRRFPGLRLRLLA